MKLLRVTESARLLGVKPSSVRRLEKLGLLKAVRDWSGHRRFLEKEIVRYRRILLNSRRNPH